MAIAGQSYDLPFYVLDNVTNQPVIGDVPNLRLELTIGRQPGNGGEKVYPMDNAPTELGDGMYNVIVSAAESVAGYTMLKATSSTTGAVSGGARVKVDAIQDIVVQGGSFVVGQ